MFARNPHDNLYPKVKAPIEIETAEELDHILKEKDFEMINKIIDSLEERTENQEFTSLLVSKIFDKDFNSVKKLYHKVINSERIQMTDTMFNQFVWGASHLEELDFLSELMQTASIMNIKVEM